MAIPSSLYNTDTIATHGTTEIELTKKIEDLYPTTGNVDNSIAYTKYNASWLYTAGVTCYPYEDGGSSVKFAEYEPDSSYCYKYYNWESDVPLTDANINVCIITPGSTAGYYYINSESIIDYGINDSRFVRNAQTNKMLFTAQARRINLTELEPYELERGSASHVFPLQTVDLKYIDSHPDEYFYDFSLTGCLVWNGSEWIAASYVPAYISTSSSSQGIATINTCFNRRGIYYDMDVRQDSELYIHEDGSSDGFEANGATGWSLGWPEDVEVAPYYIGIGDMANLNALIEAEIEGEETRIDIITCQRAIPVNEVWYYFTWCSGVYYNHLDGVRNASHSSYYCPCIKGSTLSKLIAGCGLYFLADPGADLTGITPNNLGNCADIWLGEMNGDYITTGNWVKGANINSYTGANREGNVFNGGFDPNYKPAPLPDDDDPSDDQAWGGAYSGAGAFSKFYLCTATDLANLRTWFGGGGGGDQIPDGFDPMGQILGLLQYPVSISGTALAPEEIVFRSGKTIIHTGVNADRSTGGFLHLDCGSVEIPRRMQERGVPFLDFETTLEIYVPFCGTAPLDVQTCVGKTLTCDMYVATATGDVSAVIAAGGHPVAYMSGNMAESLPISSSGYGMYLAACKSTWGNGVSQVMNQLTGGTTDTLKNVNQAALNETLSYNQTGGWGRSELIAESYNNPRIGSAMAAAAGPTGAAAIGLIKTGLNVMNAATTGYEQYKRVKNASYTSVSGSFTSCAAWNYPFTPYVKITRPHKQIPTGGHGDYKHTAAIPLVETKTLSGAPGLTTCVNPDVSGIANATAQEKDIIYRALVNGVIV